MRKLRMIVLGAALVGSGGFAPSLFAQNGDIDDCASKLTTFVKELDDLLVRNPRDLNVVYAL
jgi:hypothetical protein